MKKKGNGSQSVVAKAIKEAHIKWYPDEKRVVDCIEHAARKSQRYFMHQIKHILEKALEAGLINGN